MRRSTSWARATSKSWIKMAVRAVLEECTHLAILTHQAILLRYLLATDNLSQAALVTKEQVTLTWALVLRLVSADQGSMLTTMEAK